MMQPSNNLDDVAKQDNWIAFGDALAQAMDNPGSYGLRSSREILQKVATIKGKRAHSLTNSVNASRWLKNYNPEIFALKPVWLGMTLVLFLMKIDEMDPEEAKKIAPKVFSGQSNQVDLKKEYDELRKNKVNAPSVEGSIELSAPQRAQLFNEVVENYLHRFGAEFFKSEKITIQPGRIVDPISPDLVVTLGAGQRVAIEVKSYRLRVDRHLAITTLGYLALIQKIVPEILMIVPEGSAYDLRKMIDLRDKLSLKGIQFATLPEKGAKQAGDLKVFK
ncbi:MAG: hypothetical protein V7727_20810 [Sneathiella sp.]